MDKLNDALGRTGYEYETLMNLLQVSVSKHILDENYTMVWCNDYYYELIGYPKEEYEALFHNKPALYYMNEELDVHDEELWQLLSAKVNGAISAGDRNYSLITRMRRKRHENHREYMWVRLNACFTDEYVDGYQVSYSVMTDITDIMEMRLEQSVTYDSLPGFVSKFRVTGDLDFKLLEANDRFFAFFGKDSLKNMDNPLFRENIERNLPVFVEHRDAISNGDPVHFTVQMRDQFGNDAWLQINASCIGRQDGDPVYLSIYIDITNETQLRQMQKQLEAQAERLRSALDEAEAANRAKSDFLSSMSHDIRTPLNAVLGMRDIAEAHLDDPGRVKDCLKKIGLSGRHLLGLINDVLDMSKIENGGMVLRENSISLPEVLENIITIMQPQFKEKGQHFSIHLQSVIHEQFLSDELRLQQIFLNILSNAYKFTPADGTILMDVRELSAENGVARFLFTITDMGIGMKPEFLAQIFTAFSRERDSRVDKTEGTGLGMAITKKIVDLLGGTIQVSSELGKGTSFCVMLPLKIEEMPGKEGGLPDLKVIFTDDGAVMEGQKYDAALLERRPDLNGRNANVNVNFAGRRLLLIEDNGLNQEVARELLSDMGAEVDIACDGAQGVEIFERSPAGYFDMILMDVQMPVMNGYEATRAIRALRRSDAQAIPILAMTADAFAEDVQAAADAGMNGHMAKPLDRSSLGREIGKYLGER